ncbi:MAG: hypothetical protein ACTHJT_06425 [Cytophaga sp.]|uniref:hypothetical protein n=1 Tax=Cytophaga sp. TaxID=29535 RepID=UPI003F8102B9
MKKIVFTSIAMAAVSFITFAQKDTTVKPQVIKDTIKTKLTGSVHAAGIILTSADDDSTKKVTPVKKPSAPKPDTLKTGSLKKTDLYAFFTDTPTDSTKTKIKSDTIKSDTKNTTGSYSTSSYLLVLADDSTKKVVKPDTTISKPADPQKRTGALYFDKKTGSIIALPKSYIEEV